MIRRQNSIFFLQGICRQSCLSAVWVIVFVGKWRCYFLACYTPAFVNEGFVDAPHALTGDDVRRRTTPGIHWLVSLWRGSTLLRRPAGRTCFVVVITSRLISFHLVFPFCADRLIDSPWLCFWHDTRRVFVRWTAEQNYTEVLSRCRFYITL